MLLDLNKRLSREELEAPISEYLSPFEYTFPTTTTVATVIHTLQSKERSREVDFFYVTDKENVLMGVVTAHDLLYHSPKAHLIDILDTDFSQVFEDESLEKGLKLITQLEILTVPVVNRQKQFVGVLEIQPQEHESLGKSKRSERKDAKTDIFQFIGLTIEQGKTTSSLKEFRYRMPWLACNLFGGLVCAVIGEFFQLTLQSFVILALFIPLVLSLSESISIQSMTLSLRFLHLRKIHPLQVWRRILIEWKTSLLLAITCAAIIGAFYFAMSLEVKPIIAIGVSMLISMVFAATFGAAFPIVLHIFKLDPKVAAGPVILMLADVVTITIYLSISTWLLI